MTLIIANVLINFIIVFNVGDYRRDLASDAAHGASASFFAPDNQQALIVRQSVVKYFIMEL